MLSRVIRLVRAVKTRVPGAVQTGVTWLVRRIRNIWSTHLGRVANNAAYAAATTAVVGALLGLADPRDAAAAVLAAALGVYLNGRREYGGAMTRRVDPWDLA